MPEKGLFIIFLENLEKHAFNDCDENEENADVRPKH